jgi:hypothetical protein
VSDYHGERWDQVARLSVIPGQQSTTRKSVVVVTPVFDRPNVLHASFESGDRRRQVITCLSSRIQTGSDSLLIRQITHTHIRVRSLCSLSASLRFLCSVATQSLYKRAPRVVRRFTLLHFPSANDQVVTIRFEYSQINCLSASARVAASPNTWSSYLVTIAITERFMFTAVIKH